MAAADIITKVGGMWAGDELERIFQGEVAGLLKRPNPRHFPGAQPVSFARQHIEELKAQDYFVCEKTDGIRYLMYLTSDDVSPEPGAPPERTPVVYLIDRKNKYYYVPRLRFPHQENPPKKYDNFHVDTILDGELVEDRYPDGRSTIKFLVFDLLVIDGKDLRERTLDKRLGYLKQFILQPYKNWLKDFPEQRHSQAFVLEDKKTEFSYSLPTMFHEIIPQVKQLHGNDGLIFTCKGTKYESGTDRHILKWKPPEENTVDFLLHITWAGEPEDEDYDEMPADLGLYIYHGRDQDYSRVGSLYVTPDEWEKLKAQDEPLQDSIVECFLEDTGAVNGHSSNGNQVNGHGEKRWRYHRTRDDKNEANHVTTFDSVKISIQDHVTQQDLLDHADDIRTAWKARDARRPSRPQ
ncbi:Dcp1p-Dcp2p decapping enzyme complex alpha subunit [Exophiala xenobiotica]|nr:Dcp1p-Dcp2p decapping enzyme complex alpha subunit [Exophiala xenobiotica]